MGGPVGDDFVAGTAMDEDRDFVAHGAGRQEHRRFLAKPFGHHVAETIDRRVFAVDVVADLGLRHGTAHGRRGLGGGIAPQIDDARCVGVTGRRADAERNFYGHGEQVATPFCQYRQPA